MPCCKSNYYFWCRYLPIVDYKDEQGNEYCLFHAPEDKKGVDLWEFQRLVFEKISKAQNEGVVCNFTGAVFPWFLRFNEIPQSTFPAISFRTAKFLERADFSGITFIGEANFQHAKFIDTSDFENSIFNGTTDFSGTVFNKEARFVNAKFQEETSFFNTDFIWRASFRKAEFNKFVSFLVAKFKGNTNFANAKFKSVQFDNAQFNLDADFGDALFEGNATFSKTIFGNASFYGVKFNKIVDFYMSKLGVADFTGVEFSDEASFVRTTFSGRANFYMTTFLKKAYFGKLFLRSVDDDKEFAGAFINGVGFGDVQIKEKVIFEEVNLKKVSFIDTDLRKIDFTNCTWQKKMRRNVLYDEIALFSNIKDTATDKNFIQRLKSRVKGSLSEILKQELNGFKKNISCDKDQIQKVEILYRQLKQKCKEEHNEHDASIWHYGEKEMFRKSNRLRRFLPSISTLYWLSSGYSESPIRAGVILILLILAMSILLGLTGLNSASDGKIIKIESWIDISNLNYLKATLQYSTFEQTPDFIPANWFLKLAAKILIPLQTALFALAVRNRFRR